MDIDPRLGTTLAGYRIESVIGRGGMGVVYLAEHVRLKRKVALKVLTPELARDELFRDRFIHESELAASLDHPNIIDIHDAGEADGLLYLAMRYVSGPDLKNMIKQDGPLDPERAVGLLTQVAGALDAAHERGLVHRDIKPANILVNPPTSSLGEHAYLTDFGLTKRPESMSGLTKTGQFLGSVEYAAPEQFEGKPLGPWTDVYSLGGVAYECLTADIPYRRDTEAAVMHAHLHEPPPKVSAKRPELPAGLDAAVGRAMAKRPEDRYERAGAFAQALAAGARGELVEPGGPPPRRRRAVVWAAALFAVALIAGAAYALTRSEAPPTRPAQPVAAPLGVVRVDPATNRITDFIDIPTAADIAVGGGFVWVEATSSLDKVNQSSKLVVGHVPIKHGFFGSPFLAKDVAYGKGRVWDLGTTADEVDFTVSGVAFEIDPTTNRIVRELSIPSASSLAVTDEALWVGSAANGEVHKVDPESGGMLATASAEITQNSANSLGAGPEGVWVVQTLPGLVTHIDPETGNVVGTISIPNADGVAVGGGSVWVTSEETGTVTRVNPATESIVKTITIGRPSADRCGVPGGIALSPTDVWVLSSEDGTLVRIDRRSERIVARIPIGACPYAVAVDDAGVWVSRTSNITVG